ncbi:hypothetical protein XCR1_1370008 [Xenorhabdus cabanillasii JM26]|uniref:Uncharacterized protein n=1 Tax=Xenorhabdus cabanillasii JM26 TaxID=1427517 RepID=W1IQJ4_9GAMM|nr:hypothetical protein XCR1_1370008 [Xenorhabdus cabanillasii JM26]
MQMGDETCKICILFFIVKAKLTFPINWLLINSAYLKGFVSEKIKVIINIDALI